MRGRSRVGLYSRQGTKDPRTTLICKMFYKIDLIEVRLFIIAVIGVSAMGISARNAMTTGGQTVGKAFCFEMQRKMQIYKVQSPSTADWEEPKKQNNRREPYHARTSQENHQTRKKTRWELLRRRESHNTSLQPKEMTCQRFTSAANLRQDGAFQTPRHSSDLVR